MIQSLNNTHIKETVKLKQKKYREQAQMFLAEGEHLVEEAVKQGLALEIFYTDQSKIPPTYHGICTEVSYPVLEKLACSKTPQSVIARCRYLKWSVDWRQMTRIFVLDGLQDPGNIGTIIRTALAMGFDAVILSQDSVDLYHDKLLRACQGANFYLPVIQKDILRMLETLRFDGFQIYGTALQNATAIQKISSAKQMAFVLGNEGNGMKEEVLKQCDQAIYIPIQKAESLNVAIAAGMLAYQFSSNIPD